MTRLEWSREAVDCLQRIHAHIAFDNPFNAGRVLARLIGTISLLAHSPMMGRISARYQRLGFRELVRRPYRIVYWTRSDRVVVLAIGDSRRDLPPRLKDW